MTDTTNAAPTLYGRLRDRLVDVAGDTESQVIEATTYYDVKDTDLAAIEAAMIDAATAPLRAKIETRSAINRELGREITALRAENAALREAGTRLRNAGADATFFIDESDEERIGGALERAIAAYDAATASTGEDAPTPTDAPMTRKWETVKTVHGINLVADPSVPAGDALVINGGNVVGKITGLAVPTPTEADQDPALQARPDRERIDDLITRADGASDRLDLHMQRMDSLQRQIGNLQRRIAALEAARTPEPEPVVTDAMVDAFWKAYVPTWGGVLTRDKKSLVAPVRRGLAAALKAGGAR